jgi:uncharacterized membrane protein
MNRDAFLRSLRGALAGLPPQEIEDIVADYAAYFEEARASGRSEENVAAALGDPARLGRELRAETGLRRWETHRSPANLLKLLLAFGGLAAVDILFLLPLVMLVVPAALVIGLVLFVVGIVGIGLLLSVLVSGHFASAASLLARGLIGVGLIAGIVGSGALLLLLLNIGMTALGRYARLHYRLLKPDQDIASPPRG